MLILFIICLFACGNNAVQTVTEVKSGNVVELGGKLNVHLAGIEDTEESKAYLVENVLNQRFKFTLDKKLSSRTSKYVYLSNRSIGSINRAILQNGFSPFSAKTCSDSIHKFQSLTLDTAMEDKADVTGFNDLSKNDASSKNMSGISDVIEEVKENVFLIIQYDEYGNEAGIGTGFFIDNRGTAVSNYHVFEGGNDFRVKFSGSKLYSVNNIYAYDKDEDYLIFSVDLEGRAKKGISFANRSPKIGDDIYVLGNPKGLETTLSKGIVSSIRSDYNLIQIDAAMSPGSSGSPVINTRGEVIGIATMKLMECENCNFAVDIDLIKRELKQLN